MLIWMDVDIRGSLINECHFVRQMMLFPRADINPTVPEFLSIALHIDPSQDW